MVIIREFKEEDAVEVCNLIRRCDKEISSKDYSKNIIAWWDQKLTERYIIEKSKERRCYVAVLKKKVIGYISFDGKEIKKLHVNPDQHGLGIGKKLIKAIECFSKGRNIRKIIVESSIYAEKFYERCGFKKLKIKYPKHNGERFKLILMEKKLSNK